MTKKEIQEKNKKKPRKKIKSPKFLEIFSEIAVIEIINKVQEENSIYDDLYGFCDYPRSNIKIFNKQYDKNGEEFELSIDKFNIVFLHEWLHYFLYSIGENKLSNNEKLLDKLAQGINQLLQQIEIK